MASLETAQLQAKTAKDKAEAAHAKAVHEALEPNEPFTSKDIEVHDEDAASSESKPEETPSTSETDNSKPSQN